MPLTIQLAREPEPGAVRVYEGRSSRRTTRTRLLVDEAAVGLSGTCVPGDGRRIPVLQWP